MYYVIEKDLIYTIIYNEKIERVFVEDPNAIEVGSILHARVKRVDKNRSFSFVEMGGVDGFYNDCDLKAGGDYLFNIRKKPEGEKGYVLDRQIKITLDNHTMYPLSSDYYDNEAEKIIGCPVRVKRPNDKTIQKLLAIKKEIDRQKSQLPIPKIVYKNPPESQLYIDTHREEEGTREEMERAMQNTPEIKGRHVKLDEGSLIIDTHEHFTFVDFNTDDYSKNYTRELNHLELNKKLLAETIRILTLRNIEGMILIDLLKMKDNHELITYTRQILKTTDYNYHDITKLGIMELTRKKYGRQNSDEYMANIML